MVNACNLHSIGHALLFSIVQVGVFLRCLFFLTYITSTVNINYITLTAKIFVTYHLTYMLHTLYRETR